MMRMLAFAAIYLCWGGTFLAIRYLVTEMPPLLSMALRCAGGAALFLLWLVLRGSLARTDAAQWRVSFLSGLFLFLGCHGILAWAEQRVASGEAALLMTSIPLWLVSLDAARQRQWPARRVMLGLGLGVLGVAVLSAGGGGWSGGLADRLALVASGFCWAIGSLIGRDGPRPRSAAQTTAMQLVTGSVALLIVSFVLGEWSAWSPAGLSSRAQLSLGFLILGGTVAGFGAYTWLLRVSTPGAVGSYAFVNPLVAVLLAHLAGDGTVDLRTVVAMTFVLGAVMLTRDVPGPSREKDTSREPPVERGPRLVSPVSGTQ